MIVERPADIVYSPGSSVIRASAVSRLPIVSVECSDWVPLTTSFCGLPDWLETTKLAGPAPSLRGETEIRSLPIDALTLIAAGDRTLAERLSPPQPPIAVVASNTAGTDRIQISGDFLRALIVKRFRDTRGA